jgi:DtxR family Mn-dependent transcriptional regulator
MGQDKSNFDVMWKDKPMAQSRSKNAPSPASDAKTDGAAGSPALPFADLRLRVPNSCRIRLIKDPERAEMPSEIVQEYLEGIYRLETENEKVSTGHVAAYMCVSAASATAMLKRMAEAGLAEHTPYHGITLTPRGVELALKLVRAHRLAERLLTDIVGIPWWEDIHEIACRLEHVISGRVADRMAEALGNPLTCPHGNPIDARVNDGSVRLTTIAAGTDVELVKIGDEQTDFLQYLASLGLCPGARFTVEARAPFNGPLTLRIGAAAEVIGVEAAHHLWVHAAPV